MVLFKMLEAWDSKLIVLWFRQLFAISFLRNVFSEICWHLSFCILVSALGDLLLFITLIYRAWSNSSLSILSPVLSLSTYGEMHVKYSSSWQKHVTFRLGWHRNFWNSLTVLCVNLTFIKFGNIPCTTWYWGYCWNSIVSKIISYHYIRKFWIQQ